MPLKRKRRQSEVARLRELQKRKGQTATFWLSEIAVQLARLIAQQRYKGHEDDAQDRFDFEEPPF